MSLKCVFEQVLENSVGYAINCSRVERSYWECDEKSTPLFCSDFMHVLILVLVCITIEKNN